ncbi:MAG: hypothetical protein GF331_01690 [Chitinivibrionales bacterium]|nr:hypothetical protein [Chitinivibrionales bacterium]
MRRIFRTPALLLAVMVVAAHAEWRTIDIDVTDNQNTDRVTFVNSQMQLEWAFIGNLTGRPITGLDAFWILRDPAYSTIPFVGPGMMDTDADGHNTMMQASLLRIDDDSATIRMLFHPSGRCNDNPVSQEVTFYRDQPFFKSVRRGCCVHLLDNMISDIPRGDTGTVEYALHGQDGWPKPAVVATGSSQMYYKRSSDGDPGSLDYNGFVIAGIYSDDLGAGFGRVVPSGKLNGIRMQNIHAVRGYEFWLFESEVTTYYYFAIGGATEVVAYGRQVVAYAKGGPLPQVIPATTATHAPSTHRPTADRSAAGLHISGLRGTPVLDGPLTVFDCLGRRISPLAAAHRAGALLLRTEGSGSPRLSSSGGH